MVTVIGVRFRNVGKVYYFSPLDFEIHTGDHVIVETARGVEYGTVALGPREVDESKVVQPLKEVIRVANAKDTAREQSNREKEREAFKICQKKIREHNLEMKLIDAEYTFDNNKVLFYFTADGRIDFRELVKDLAAVFKTRIELRQIGVRDETKILGGIGICGRPLCCHTYLSDFAPVSIKMAKEQNLSLNPTKISGVCGRLMCCLKNEQDTYEYLNKRLPNNGDLVILPDGEKGEVAGTNVLRQTVKVLIDVGDEKEMKEYPVDELKFHSRGRKVKETRESDVSAEELKELENLEDNPKDVSSKTGESRNQDEKGRPHKNKSNREMRRPNPKGDSEKNTENNRQERKNDRRQESREGRQDAKEPHENQKSGRKNFQRDPAKTRGDNNRKNKETEKTKPTDQN